MTLMIRVLIKISYLFNILGTHRIIVFTLSDMKPKFRLGGDEHLEQSHNHDTTSIVAAGTRLRT